MDNTSDLKQVNADLRVKIAYLNAELVKAEIAGRKEGPSIEEYQKLTTELGSLRMITSKQKKRIDVLEAKLAAKGGSNAKQKHSEARPDDRGDDTTGVSGC